MARIIIRGSAAVFSGNEQVTDPDILRSLDGLMYDDERFTDYLGGPPGEDLIAAVLEPGGVIRFCYREGDEQLMATTEYWSRRPLNEEELRILVEYTMGQWSDGIGENWACFSEERCGYMVMCHTPGDLGVGPNYPSVQVTEK